MLFNSPIFIFLFLPISLAGYFFIGKKYRMEAAFGWLVLCSLFFYGWWNPAYLLLIFASISVNYGLGQYLNKAKRYRKALLIIGITLNLALLGYYKYANFFVDSLNWLVSGDFNLQTIILPLAISFFTFQQISYLVDTYRGETKEYNFLHYCLFVTFFPQLIAGPIVHHKEMLPQFMVPNKKIINYRNLALGTTIFLLGLLKKTVFADGIAPYSTVVFNAALNGTQVNFFEAWGGSLAYTFQLYFDFSGYSDMAIGLALLFGIRLPMNFFSPYKARNISEFWRRWHMTLSRFLRDYLYIALGGNRNGSFNRYRNLFLTMLIGGLWHGSAWTFVLWGGLHGLYLIAYHGWNNLLKTIPTGALIGKLTTPLAYTLTFFAIVAGWVLFRAESFDAAIIIFKGMAGLNGFILDADSERWRAFFEFIGISIEVSDFATRLVDADTFIWIVICALICWRLPNIYQITAEHATVLDESRLVEQTPNKRLRWQPNLRWALTIAFLGTIALINMNKVSEFLYFQF